ERSHEEARALSRLACQLGVVACAGQQEKMGGDRLVRREGVRRARTAQLLSQPLVDRRREGDPSGDEVDGPLRRAQEVEREGKPRRVVAVVAQVDGGVEHGIAQASSEERSAVVKGGRRQRLAVEEVHEGGGGLRREEERDGTRRRIARRLRRLARAGALEDGGGRE